MILFYYLEICYYSIRRGTQLYETPDLTGDPITAAMDYGVDIDTYKAIRLTQDRPLSYLPVVMLDGTTLYAAFSDAFPARQPCIWAILLLLTPRPYNAILDLRAVSEMADVWYSLEGMDFVWDSNKDSINRQKHGISFETASHVFLDSLRLDFPDRPHSTPEEQRYFTIGLVENILTVVYCERGGVEEYAFRIISARTASPAERRAYNNAAYGRRR